MKLIAPAPETRISLGYHYTARPLLTASEARLFNCLERLAGGRCHIMCKPRLADVMKHHDGIAGLNKVSQKHVDFLLCRKGDWMAMLGVELDDPSHRASDRKARDMFVNSLFAYVSIPLVRIDVTEMDAVEALMQKLFLAWERRTLTLEGNARKVVKNVNSAPSSSAATAA